MIIDRLENAPRYYTVHKRISEAFHFLHATDLTAITPGKHTIDGDNLFAIVQEYDTMDSASEQMEAHKKYIDVQYMILGAELVGHAILTGQTPSKVYDAAADYMLFPDTPSFFSKMDAGTFMVFFPTDLHMPCIKEIEPATVKKVVVKVRVE
jgi:YhcH/YjgK/YiaL family protein